MTQGPTDEVSGSVDKTRQREWVIAARGILGENPNSSFSFADPATYWGRCDILEMEIRDGVG